MRRKLQQNRFVVPKITDDKGNVTDIRVVYNTTSCKLNAKVWAPNFWMPTINTPLGSLSYGYWSLDFDIGEMCLNFSLLLPLQNLAEVQMELIKNHLESILNSPPLASNKSWTQFLFGYRTSQFCTIKLLYHAKEQIKGCCKEKNNPLWWDRVTFNLPGQQDFDPPKPFVILWDNFNKRIAGSMTIFVDNGRGTGCSKKHAWRVAKHYMTRLQFLGIQNAARKVQPPTQSNTGAWANAIIKTMDNNVTKTVLQAKWNKAKDIVNKIISKLKGSGNNSLDFKQLEKYQGYLIHVCTTYKQFVPFMKGIHHTLDLWRPN